MHKTTGFVLVLKRMTRDINCVNKKKKRIKKRIIKGRIPSNT